MFTRRPTSEDRRVYLARFEFEDQSGGVYLDGAYTTRGFVSEDERGLRLRLERLIEEGRLSLDAGGRNKPEIVSVERRGDIITVKIRGETVERAVLGLPRLRRRERHRMHPVLDYDLARSVREMLEGDRFYEFVELLESFTPLIEEREVMPFDGRTIHPVSTRTILSEMNVYSKGLSPGHKREARTVILLDRSMSMANAWSLWEEYPKIRVGRFLSNVVGAVQSNSVLYSFGLGIRPEDSAEDVSPRDEETRLDLALREAALLDPERIVIITDGKPVYSPGSEAEELCDGAVETLDAMARAGVLVLVALLGYDYDMVRFYKRLEQNPSVTLVELAASSDVAEMMHKLSDWL